MFFVSEVRKLISKVKQAKKFFFFFFLVFSAFCNHNARQKTKSRLEVKQTVIETHVEKNMDTI